MNNEEKILALLEKMATKDDIVAVNSRLDAVEESQRDIRESQRVIRDSQLRVELEQFPKINAALDGAAGNYDKNVEQDRRISSLEGKTEDHDKMIFALERAVKAK
ncbi:MAG: hypothetical protein FWG32_07625 [Oscillospiraceae bacterium]|nr:hypothetical protein [Oscillospiraceae bacterium]